MQKKLMAIAVAGALGAPAVAFAQASTVQVYGQITYEYGIANQGDATGGSRPNVDYADTPGGSAIGFRGEEKLGGGMSAWFQCETSADIRGIDQVGLCSRNSAVGFKGGFGNIHFGRWDTPMKRALNVGTVGAEETGLLGMSFLPFGGSGGSDATGAGPDSPNRQRWKRREVGLTYYESPRFGGFQVLAAFSPGNRAADTGALDTTPNSKPRVISLSGIYQAGPLGIGLAYERHNEFGAYTPVTTFDADDRAWGASASYKFGPVEIGATYLDAKYETGPGLERKKKTATVGVEWALAGPHSIEAQYAWAGDTKGNDTAGVVLGGNGGVSASGSDTGGDAISIAYRYRFSKRTSIKLGYVTVDNDSAATTYRVGNTASVRAGERSSAVAFHIRHRF
jgi:predicted porin